VSFPERLIRAADNDRDRLMILMGYRHGLRVFELIRLEWRHIDLEAGRVRVKRLKGSDESMQPLGGRALRRP
jgi:integrase